MYLQKAIFDFITVFVRAEPIALIYKQQPIKQKQPNKKKEQKNKSQQLIRAMISLGM